MGTYDDRPCVYMHGYISARLMRLPSKAEEEAGHPGLPVCVAASHFDGLVMALAPFHNSYNYRSAVLHGWAKLVADEDERLAALERITNNVVADNWSNCRMPPTKAELTTTAVLRVEVETASAKVRIGGPDDDRADLRNEDVVGRFWTGVVPAWVQYGEPVESDHNKVAKVPDYFKTFLQTQNEKNKEVAIKAVEPPPKKK
ncbi:hypothetical protein BDY21DRAFT_344063 [Lineolata rhizophorae]|uniref:Flavin-nucleotide-binding protein n=1 Tax=Lineolata rhizophorae TaxID=578093 RepID=A0A6A6P0N2_9PEZI|nr:hypothetical protein BDY21DRAFT_344063 [Lineolata rhizophorae]